MFENQISNREMNLGNLKELKTLKTDEEAKEFIQKNITQQNVKENKEFISVSCEKIFLQTTLLLLSLTTRNNKEYFKLTTNPNAIHALFLSLKFNFYQLFDLLVDKGVNLLITENKQTIIEYAIEIGNHNAVRYLLIDNKKTSHFFATNGKCTLFNAFFTSISLNDIFHVQFFLDQLQVDVNSQNKTGRNALHVCAINNQIGIAKTLILRGIDLYHIDRENRNALHLSLYYKHFEFAKYLMKETSININHSSHSPYTQIHLLLAVTIPQVDKKRRKSENLLSDTVKNEIFLFTKYFIEETKIDLTIKNGDGNNLLLLSVICNHFDLIKYLIEDKKMDIQVTNKRLFNALFLGIKENVNEDILEYLYNKNVNWKSPTYLRPNLLLYSIVNKKINFAKFMIENGKGKKFNLEKALEKSIKMKLNEFSIYLIRKGANIHSSNTKSKSPAFIISVLYNNFEFAKYLVCSEMVGNVNQYNLNYFGRMKEWTILSLLAERNSPSAFAFVKYLIEEKDLSLHIAVNSHDDSTEGIRLDPLLLSIRRENWNITKYLIDRDYKIDLNVLVAFVRRSQNQQFKSFFESYLLLKGLEKCFVPHTHITLPFSHHNLSDWKSLFISTLNYSPLIYQKKK